MLASVQRWVAAIGDGFTRAVTLAALTCAVMALAGPAQALAYVEAPYLRCFDNTQGVESVIRNMALEPANGATVPAGAPVVFSGESNYALMFSVASSEALLSDPDIDSGAGTQSGAFYRFMSTKATGAPRTIYWAASFIFTPEGCESPSTFTTPIRTLIVGPSEAELAATKKQQEEAAVQHKLEEEAAARNAHEEEAAAGDVFLNSVTAVKNGRAVAVTLTCWDVATCGGKLTLTTAVVNGKGRKGRAKSERIGVAGFSIAASERAVIRVPIDKAGRSLVGATHGQLSAVLTIIRTSPLPQETQTQQVRLKQRKARNAE